MNRVKKIENDISRLTCDPYSIIEHSPDPALRILHEEVDFQQIPEEFALVLWNLAGLKNEKKYPNVLEIGIATGYSVMVFDHFLDVESFTLIDDGKYHKFDDHEKVLFGINYDLFVGDSTSTEAINFVESKNLTFDLIHIDANHLYGYVLQDFKNYSEFLSEDGIIILHDSLHLEGPRRVLIETYSLEHGGFKVLCNIGNKFGSAIIARKGV